MKLTSFSARWNYVGTHSREIALGTSVVSTLDFPPHEVDRRPMEWRDEGIVLGTRRHGETRPGRITRAVTDVATARNSQKEAMSDKEAGIGMIRSGISTTGSPGTEDNGCEPQNATDGAIACFGVVCR